MRAAYLGLGSNIDARANIVSAMEALRRAFNAVAFSPVYSSPAQGFEGGDFLNLATRIDTAMSPLELRAWLAALEDSHDRDRSAPKWSDRTLDVDILLYDDYYLLSPQLELPRKEILTAAHVLKPLADLAPDLVHPVARRTMAELWARFPNPSTPLKQFSM